MCERGVVPQVWLVPTPRVCWGDGSAPGRATSRATRRSEGASSGPNEPGRTAGRTRRAVGAVPSVGRGRLVPACSRCGVPFVRRGDGVSLTPSPLCQCQNVENWRNFNDLEGRFWHNSVVPRAVTFVPKREAHDDEEEGRGRVSSGF